MNLSTLPASPPPIPRTTNDDLRAQLGNIEDESKALATEMEFNINGWTYNQVMDLLHATCYWDELPPGVFSNTKIRQQIHCVWSMMDILEKENIWWLRTLERGVGVVDCALKCSHTDKPSLLHPSSTSATPFNNRQNNQAFCNI